MQADTEQHSPSGKTTYETRDVNVRGIVYFVAVLFIVLVFALISMRWLFGFYSETQALGPGVTPFANSRTLPPEPRLQVHPEADLNRMREEQDEILNSYGWVDRANGKVRIPIDRAMDLLLQKGLPARQNPPAQTPQPSASNSGREQEK
jgi:hypothetical protein